MQLSNYIGNACEKKTDINLKNKNALPLFKYDNARNIEKSQHIQLLIFKKLQFTLYFLL
ncbi:hypothetical protein DF22_001887 [Xylella fastidiosa]|nr:hypothetical protein P303_08505 [Xylella fastidiosa MUL0034]EWG15447.1 hypothetical protein P910_001270 [Xylella fastidiosa Mul-MD]KFA41308.1 hypothetical protein DF22_001887 [Xylella fastidiosa]MDS9990046.1 hypothetical protein [Xylella fastidiosa]